LRKELSLAIIAIVLALIAVQTASLLQNPSAAALMKGASVPETSSVPKTSARLQIDQSTYLSLNQTVSWVVLGPLAIAAVCYLLARKRM
jgi:hypothetical protein